MHMPRRECLLEGSSRMVPTQHLDELVLPEMKFSQVNDPHQGHQKRVCVMKHPLSRSIASLLMLSCGAVAAFDSGSTGADGALAPTAPITIPLPASGVLNYTSINIPAGVTVKFSPNARNTPVTLLVQGEAIIAGTIDVSGANAPASAGAGDGNVADDGLPGAAGPGGFGGGRAGTNAATTGQSGVGPGGGLPFTSTSNPQYSFGGCGSFATKGDTYANFTKSDSYGSADLLPLIGGSGAAGGFATATQIGGGGGGGGGAILLAATQRISVSGSILAKGGNGGNVGNNFPSFPTAGGGGSGGAIRLVSTQIDGNGTLNVAGGTTGGWGNTNANGAGGSGYLRIEAESCTRSGCQSNLPGSLFISGLPSLRIASVNGAAAPSAPTGSADIVLPTDAAATVPLVVETTNVPVGNTVTIIVTPQNGNPVKVTSTALAGTEAAATASANVAIGNGSTILLATLSYSVSGSQATAFMDYTNGEKVARIELAAHFDGTTQTLLVTESGRKVTL